MAARRLHALLASASPSGDALGPAMLWDQPFWGCPQRDGEQQTKGVPPRHRLGVPHDTGAARSRTVPPVCCWEGKHTSILRNNDWSSKCHPCMVCPCKESSWWDLREKKKRGFLLPFISLGLLPGLPIARLPWRANCGCQGGKSVPVPLSAARTSTETTEHDAP